MSTGAWILVAAVVLALGFGLWRMATDGRFRGTHDVRGAEPSGGEPSPAEGTPAEQSPAAAVVAAVGGELGERATLLQFSSAFCAPCRATRRILEDVTGVVPGVTHVEVDAEAHLDEVRRLGIARTPTTVVLDGVGREVSRASGAPRKEQVLAALAQAVPEDAEGSA